MTYRLGAHSAKARKEAMVEAEATLKRPGPKDSRQLSLKLTGIKTRPVLFQPREFSAGLRDTDKHHVETLKHNAEVNDGKLDPVLVIKLGREWVCVDGHHRLAAYGEIDKNTMVPCEWFEGTVRDALDESMRRNNKDKLNVPKQDKYEEAWKRELIGGWSKREVRTICHVSESTIAQMRRVIRAAQADDAEGAMFREQLAVKTPTQAADALMVTSWSMIKLKYRGISDQEITAEGRAERLAQAINRRLEDTLSRDPAVTARALQLYDPELPGKLMEAWGKPAPAWLATADVDPYSGVEADTVVLDDKDL